ncbi:MAG: hypothetical protein WEC59_02190 [Salibacteraceae bacterium]
MRIIIIALFSCSFFNLNAQGLQEKYLESCECWEIKNHYDNGVVSSIHFENEARKRDGEAKTFNTNGDLLRLEHFKNGRLHGESTHYHTDGNVYLEAKHDNGQQIGTWIFRDTDGTPTQEINYSGKGVDGVYAHYYAGVRYIEQTIENGKLVSNDILNEEIYNIVQEESSKTDKAN